MAEPSKFAGSVMLGDLDDFIAPSQACVNPILSTGKDSKSGLAEISLIQDVALEEPDLIKTTTSSAATVSLDDCLACSGCVTSAETVLIQQQSGKQFLNTVLSRDKELIVVSVSPQSKASLASAFNVSVAHVQRFLTAFLHAIGSDAVISTGPGNDLALIEARAEFVERYRNFKGKSVEWCSPPVSRAVSRSQTLLLEGGETVESESLSPDVQPLPILADHCPGWVCYAEKKHPQSLQYLSTAKSAQQVTGTLVKQGVCAAAGLAPASVYHATIMMCYDKKLEASRRDFSDGEERDVDCVLTTAELVELLEIAGVSLDSEEPTFDPKEILERLSAHCGGTVPPSRVREGTRLAATVGKLEESFGLCLDGSIASMDHAGSGGYMEHVFRWSADQLFGQEVPPETPLVIKRGRNKDLFETSLSVDGEVVLRFAVANGFRNIQGILRRLKRGKSPYDYVEIMACPGGCLRGAGQVKKTEKESSIEEVFHSSSVVDPLKTVAAREAYSTLFGGGV